MRANRAPHFSTRQQHSNGENGRRPKNGASKSESTRQVAPTKPHDYHQLVARATNDAVRDWNLTTGTLNWPHGLDTVLGWKAEAANHSLLFWQKHIHPDDRSRVTKSIREAIKSGAHNWSAEYRFEHGGGSYLILLERALILRNSRGVAERFVGVLMDVTNRKPLQDQLVRAQKMEAFGHLAAGVAHDFNNALTAILGYSDLVAGEIDGRSTVAKYMNEIRQAAARASALSEQLLKFSRRQTPESRVLSLNTLLTDLERTVLPLLGEHISTRCESFSEDKAVHIAIDPQQFAQVMVNLAVNARDAMPEGGTIILKAELISISGPVSHPNLRDMVPGEYAVVSVIDQGPGMSKDIQERLFEPFFTTKNDARISGLGLAACDAIVRKNGGCITLENGPGNGTAVRIYLPVVANPAPTTPKKPRLSQMPTGHETVLVVEDDASVRHVTVRTLRLLGYNVIEAVRADEAKRCIDQHPEAIDLVVSDIMLPDISGRDFAKWTRAHSPCTQTVLISGYLPYVTPDGENSDPVCLPKPFDPEQLAVTVRSVLDGARL